jgi:hypothetical protein
MQEIALKDVIVEVLPAMLLPFAFIHLLELTEAHALLMIVVIQEEAFMCIN